jgi:hypothetical protein
LNPQHPQFGEGALSCAAKPHSHPTEKTHARRQRAPASTRAAGGPARPTACSSGLSLVQGDFTILRLSVNFTKLCVFTASPLGDISTSFRHPLWQRRPSFWTRFHRSRCSSKCQRTTRCEPPPRVVLRTRWASVIVCRSTLWTGSAVLACCRRPGAESARPAGTGRLACACGGRARAPPSGRDIVAVPRARAAQGAPGWQRLLRVCVCGLRWPLIAPCCGDRKACLRCVEQRGFHAPPQGHPCRRVPCASCAGRSRWA